MVQLIDKDAVVAEVEEIIPQRAYERETLHSEFVRGQRVAYNKVLSLLDTLEMKEVDLEKEEERLWKDFNMAECRLSKDDLEKIAEHFFELGLKAQKQWKPSEDN